MSVHLEELRVQRRDGPEETFRFDTVTRIIGPPNSSKTTLLKIVDYMFGDEDPAPNQLGPRVAARYAGAQLDVTIRDAAHTLRRAFDRSYGLLTRVQVDGESLSIEAFREWIMEELDWPLLEIPRGRLAQAATDTVPLSFRTLWRHVYRREDSWYLFAAREEEFHRRAVVAFYLGLAESRYSGEEFAVGEARRERDRAETELQAIDEITDETLRRVASEFVLESQVGTDLDSLRLQVDAELSQAQQDRQELLGVMRAQEDFSSRFAEQYRLLSERVSELRDRVRILSETIEGYEAASVAAEAELARLDRAGAAVDLFAGLPVTQCPVCAQAPPSTPESSTDSGHCYLCGQAVGPDTRTRRIEIERQVLAGDRNELQDVLGSTHTELDEARQRLEIDELALRQLGERMDFEQRDMVAPFVTELEELNRLIGGIEQQQAAIRGLRDLEARRTRATLRVQAAISSLEAAEQTWATRAVAPRVAISRCEIFAERMNEFLSEPEIGWQQPRVWLNADDFTFNVGRSEWTAALGAESRVPFLLAYHYALLNLPEDLPRQSYPPGLAVLDNPLQQGIRESVVRAGVSRLAEAVHRTGGQLVVTMPRELDLAAPHHTIRMTETFSPEAQR